MSRMWMPLMCCAIFIVLGCDARSVRQTSPELDATVELTINNFNETLWAAPASLAIVEFYAHWCPACRNYKPHFERVAKLFNGRNAVHPGIVFMGKVDCAEKINSKLCERFSIGHYPSLFWGTPGQLAWGTYDGTPKNGVELIENTPRTAESLLEWINKKIGKAYTLKDDTPVSILENAASWKKFGEGQPMLSIHDLEEAAATAYEVIVQSKLLKYENRNAFLSFLQLLAVHHPSKRCRKGSADILVNFEDIWLPTSPTGKKQPNFDFLQRLKICGNSLPSHNWMFCRGSVNGTRGYSCGLWLLFHSLSVRVDDAESKMAMKTIRDFIGNFFTCEDCRNHFMDMSRSSVDKVDTQRDLVVWLWNAHNEVNARVAKEELTSRIGDPKFPKVQWPSKEFCTGCRGNEKFDESAVYSFLMEFYGRALDTISEKKVTMQEGKESNGDDDDVSRVSAQEYSSSRVAVPIGAAFGIAMASCGFGVVACIWRTQQKRRKLLRRRM